MERREKLWRLCAKEWTYVSFEIQDKCRNTNFQADAEHFLYEVTSSMLNARRSEPTPLDFDYALSRFDLPLASIEPHLKPPISKAKVDIKLEIEEAEEQQPNSESILLGKELSGEPDRLSRPYIPTRFPSFPSKHTYKWTEIESTRERDPRKIREEAAKFARQGEEALRRLNKFSKAGNERDIKRTAEKDPKSKERHELWEQMMKDLLAGRSQLPNGKSIKDEDHSLIVNSERRHFRKGSTAKRKNALPVEANLMQS
jgi:transcription initiation factor TFIID subunit 8